MFGCSSNYVYYVYVQSKMMPLVNSLSLSLTHTQKIICTKFIMDSLTKPSINFQAIYKAVHKSSVPDGYF
jgi:hypothetical protein